MLIFMSLGIVLLSIVLQITVHEACHMFMSKAIVPTRVIAFKPWPHFYKADFYLGRTEVEHEVTINQFQAFLFVSAPLIGSVTMLFLYAAIGGIFVMATVAPILDMTFWATCAILQVKGNDGGRGVILWRNRNR